MNREIKYRAWLKEEKKMVNVETMYFTEKWIGYYIFYEEEKKKRFEFSDSENFELMQYTNYKDSKGKMIFEGDILLSSNENGTFLQLIGFGDSERDYDCMLKGFKIIDGYTLENDDYEISECKSLTQELIEKNNIPIIEKENIIMDGQWVIGNKYQNTELMELIKKRSE
jgi:hypothetical protein|nr:MAG TPA: YopX protein [Caudoviricetes sp.]